MKNIIIVLFAVILAGMVAGCGSDSVTTYTLDSLSVTFQVNSDRSLSRAEDISPTEIVYVDITRAYPDYIHQSLADGVNSVDLPKGGVYVMALVGREGTAEPSIISRGLSGAISLLGNFSIVSNGLDTLPVKNTGGDSLDLGTLTTGDNVFESGADSAEVENALGYSGAELDSYSIFDKSLLKVMNPDINRNGVYDDEENLQWRLSGMRTYAPYQASEVDLDNDIINVSLDRFTSNTDFNFVFWSNDSFPHPAVENVWLTLPEGNTYVDYDGNTVTGVHPEYDNTGEGPGGQFDQYYFPFNRDIETPEAPYSGDYVLDLDGSFYYFYNVNYLSADDYGSGGFLVPFVEVAFDQDDLLTTITWKWYKIEGNGYVPANSEEVHLQILEFYFYLPDDSRILGPWDWGLNYYDNGTVDISSLGIHKSEMDGGNTLHYDYWDRAENDNGFILTVE